MSDHTIESDITYRLKGAPSGGTASVQVYDGNKVMLSGSLLRVEDLPALLDLIDYVRGICAEKAAVTAP